jgi:hypothetical protein
LLIPLLPQAFATFWGGELVSKVTGNPKHAEIAAFMLEQALTVGLFFTGAWFFNRGRRMRLPSLKEALDEDKRPPILFLRSFNDEDMALPKQKESRSINPQVWQHLGIAIILLVPRFIRFLMGRETTRLEEHLGWFFRERGPFVAIGKPGDRIITPGAARAYLGKEDWRVFVDELMVRS